SDEVEVQANAALVETRSTAVGQVMENVRILELPLNGRQVTDLIVLSGAAVGGGAQATGTVTSGRNYPTRLDFSRGRHEQRSRLYIRWRNTQRSLQQPQSAAALSRCAPGIQGGDQRVTGPIRTAFVGSG